MTKIIEEKENLLLNRKEIKLVAEAGKNPSYDEALAVVAEKFKAQLDNIVMKQVKGKFGRNTFLINAFIYKSKEDKEKFERKKKVKKAAGEEQASAPVSAKK